MAIDSIAASGLMESLLPPGMFVKDLITDERNNPLYNYEDWLRELLSASEAFVRKTSGEELKKPTEESHGEADAISSNYSIDFKLVAGQSMLRALREMSQQMTVMGGLTLTHTSRGSGSMEGLRLHVALRRYSEDELRRIWNANPKHGLRNDVEREIAGYLKLLKKEKNLLLLYPAVLYDGSDAPAAQAAADDAVYSDYGAALRLRNDYLPDYENYLAYFRDGCLVILEVTSAGSKLFDSVPVSKSATFMDAVRQYDLVDYPCMDELLGRER